MADPEYEKWLKHYHPSDSHSGDCASLCPDKNQKFPSALIKDLQGGLQCVVHKSCNSDNDSDDSHASVEKQIPSDQSVQSKEIQSSVNCTSSSTHNENDLEKISMPTSS